MKSLPSQKYKNYTRVVSGTVEVNPDDSILRCDTSIAPVVINLAEIPQDDFSTIYKLYVYDNSGNASVNNITINAGAGQTINGASSITLSTNNERVFIRISSNTSYLSTSSTGNGALTQAYTTVQDEGVSLVQRYILNFIGAGVTASDDGSGKTNVVIPGNQIISLTNIQFLSLINTDSDVLGQFYFITDVGSVSAYSNGIIIQGGRTAATGGQGGTSGIGIFLNADYQKVGNYSAITGFNSNIGIWSVISSPVSIGDVVIWNNQHYLNLTGNWGTAPDADNVNWELQTRASNRGYIMEIDFIKYDVQQNLITYREDFRGNEVDYYDNNSGRVTLVDFQWGRDDCYKNKIKGNSICNFTNSNALIFCNSVFNGNLSDFTPNLEAGVICFNDISTGASLISQNTRGTIEYCRFFQGGILNITTLLDVMDIISLCTVGDFNSVVFSTAPTNISKTVVKGFSNWEATLDFSDSGVFTSTTCTIPASLAYVGIFTITNIGFGLDLTAIINAPTNHPFSFFPANSESLQTTPNAIGSSSANDIIGNNETAAGASAIGRTNGSDEFIFKKYGNLVGLIKMNIWQ